VNKYFFALLLAFVIGMLFIGCGIVTTDGSPALLVDVYDSSKACVGTTVFADLLDVSNPRIVEVDMDGNVVWEYYIPDDLKQYYNPGLDVEVLSTNNILFVLPGKGIYEINRSGTIVWSHLDADCSHDADRLANGDTIYVFGNDDTKQDAQVKQVNSSGQLVWSWYAKDDFDVAPYNNIWDAGWTHINAVTRMQNGNTLVGLRNFQLTAVVSADGSVVRSYDWASLAGATDPDPHDPEVETGTETLLVALQNDSPYQGMEITMSNEATVWTYANSDLRTARDCDRLSNGNTLFVGVLRSEDTSVIFEVTPAGEIVWQLKAINAPVGQNPGWFYKAQRVCP
jgi:hypothetical protein